MAASLMTGGWLNAAHVREKLQARVSRLRIQVYVHYTENAQEGGLFIKARHPATNAIRFTKQLTFEEVKDEKQFELLLSQLWLVEPPPT